jgi:hypothetical protein
MPGFIPPSETSRGVHLAADSDPWAIINDPDLDDETKLARLRQLEYDAREIDVACEEGMQGRPAVPMLDDILAAIAKLGTKTEPTNAPTKA